MVKKLELVFGIEIECLVRSGLCIQRGSRHAGIKLNRWWEAQEDGSVYPEGADKINGYTVAENPSDNFRSYEFVSALFTSKQIPALLRSFKRIFRGEFDSLPDNKDFTKFLYFNKTTGSHVHFSLRNVETGKMNMLFRVLPRELTMGRKGIVGQVKKRVKAEAPHLYNQFEEHFFRDYAHNFRGDYSGTRSVTMNFTQNKGVEFRSFNLLGVCTFADFERMIKIAVEEIENTVLQEFKKKYPLEMDLTVKLLSDDIQSSNPIEKREVCAEFEKKPKKSAKIMIFEFETKKNEEKVIYG